MNGGLHVRNRHRARKINLGLFRKITRAALHELKVSRYELGLHLVDTAEITRLNEKFLRHAGPTDVITFDYTTTRKSSSPAGEIFICVNEAVTQARRFHTNWQAELVRYVVHGILHLLGYDDAAPANRRKMKREEDRLLKKLAGWFVLSKLAGNSKLRP